MHFDTAATNAGWILVPASPLPLDDLPRQLDGAGLLAQKVEKRRPRATQRRGDAADDVLGDEGADEAPDPEDLEEGLGWWLVLRSELEIVVGRDVE